MKPLDVRRTVHHYMKPRAASADPSWPVPEICRAYSWPANLPGGGTIGIVELGGGWLTSDVIAYFSGIGQPCPSIVDVSVDGETRNTPGVSDADGEVALDIQVAGAAYFCATGKPAQIRIYWCQNIADGIRAAYRDGCAVCSISWGADEANWAPADAADLEAAATEATAAGCVVFAAAGDNDSSDGGDSPANVDCPASAPHVIACGGTSKPRDGRGESVWNNEPGQTDGSGTGGGYSTIWPEPTWQVGAAPSDPLATGGSGGRMVPDVAAVADPQTGYEIIVAGQAQVVGGTSAVAPLYAGLFAAMGPITVGLVRSSMIGPALWSSSGRVAFVDVTQGNNGAFSAQIGPDPCTGLGVPDAGRLAALFGLTAVVTPPAPSKIASGNDVTVRANPRSTRSKVPGQPRKLPKPQRAKTFKVEQPANPIGSGPSPRPTKAPPRDPALAYGLVPPGARKPKGAIRADAGSVATTFRGRTRKP